jgi:HAD superfamily hydrolase (TIGR01484 family)
MLITDWDWNEAVDVAREEGVYYQVFFPGTANERRHVLMAEADSPGRDMYYRHTGMLARIGDIKQTLRQSEIPGCIKVMYLAEQEAQNRIRAKIEGRFGSSVYVAQTLKTFLEVMSAKVSKGKALSGVIKQLGLSKDEVIAFGDEENDLPLFSAAGFSVAPANGKENVRAAASAVCGHVNDDGVAAWLEDFFRLRE